MFPNIPGLPTISAVKAAIYTGLAVGIIATGVGLYLHVNSIISAKDKTIRELSAKLETANNNFLIETTNVATLNNTLTELSTSYDKLNDDYKFSLFKFTALQNESIENKTNSKIIKEIVADSNQSDFCKAAAAFNKKLSELNYDDI